MPIKPEDIDPSKLPVAFRGYDRAATDDLLKRVAWDYRQASRVQDTWTDERERLKKQIQQLEAQVTSQQVEFTRALTEHEATIGSASSTRSSALEAEVARLERLVRQHESRRDLTQTLLQMAQRSAKELRESTRQEAESLLKSAHRRAKEIEHDARAEARHATAEIERLRQVEADLRDRLRATLEAVIGENGDRSERAREPRPEHESSADHS
jgi:cell division septum initiation protein DivIVA